MPPYDYTDAPPPPEIKLIPPTIVTLVLHIDAGGVGEDGMLTRSQDGGCEMLVCEITVADGDHKGRKFWERWVMEGTTDGHAVAIGINRRTIKAILDSAFNLMPDDKSDKAREARNRSYKQLEGLTFIGKIGIEKGGPIQNRPGEFYSDKNILAAVITPDKKDWHPVEQPPPFNGGGSGAQAAAPSSAAPPIARPGWAS